MSCELQAHTGSLADALLAKQEDNPRLAFSAVASENAPAVRYLAEAWPQIPPHIREAIFVLVDAALIQSQIAAQPSTNYEPLEASK